jgi:SMP-30/gluconolaconase/LRE-like protein
MLRSLLGCSLLCAAMLLWSGCSGTGTGPAVSGAPASLDGALTGNGRWAPAEHASATGAGWMSPEAKKGKNLLYVADQSAGAIEIYKQKGSNQQPIGAITQGVSGPDGIFVDPHGKLYVCNFGNGTVTVYPRAKTAPSETLTGAGSPIDVVAAADGTVYVANFNSGTNGTVLEYPKGDTTPSKTIVTFGSGSFPEGLALDSANHLYVAYNVNDGEVLEFGPGSPSGKNLGIHVGYVGGLTIDHSNDLLLDDQNLPGVDVFPPGSTTPSQQIKGFKLAFDVALNHKNTTLWVTAPFTPAAYEVSYPAGTIVDTITSLESAFGVATSPDGSQ